MALSVVRGVRAPTGGYLTLRVAMSAIFDGATRTEAAKIGGVTAQTVRD